MGRGTLAVTLLFTLGLAIGLFVLLPLFLAGAHGAARPSAPARRCLEHLIEGLIRVVIFVGYLLLVSRSAEIRRVFQYHGAEHMTIHALEHEDPLDVEHVRKYPTAHPRCGTEFLVVFIIVSILLFSLLAGQSLLVSIVGRILLVPVIAVARLRDPALRRAPPRTSWWIRWLFLPGIWLQAITTKQPDDSMIEVAIASMHEALAANGEEPPEGSLEPAAQADPGRRAPATESARRPARRNEPRGAPRRARAAAGRDRGGVVASPRSPPTRTGSAAGPRAGAAGARRRHLPPAARHARPARARPTRRETETEPSCASWRAESSTSSRREETRADRGAARPAPAERPERRARTSSSRSAPAPAARRRRCSPPSSSGCTCATPSGAAGRRS